jgi:hypothetical protein
MAGYVIYSLDWGKFSAMVERPTERQLLALAKRVADELEEMDGEFDDGDPVLEWPTDAKSLVPVVAERLALEDWYGDLSGPGKSVWEGAVFEASRGRGLGFRVDSDGVYWDVIDIACRALGRPRNPNMAVALAAFGSRPFRYYPPARRRPSFDDDYDPMHSMHTPDEVRRMLEELRSVRPALEASGHAGALADYNDELLPAVERVAGEGRMLFVQTDT